MRVPHRLVAILPSSTTVVTAPLPAAAPAGAAPSVAAPPVVGPAGPAAVGPASVDARPTSGVSAPAAAVRGVGLWLVLGIFNGEAPDSVVPPDPFLDTGGGSTGVSAASTFRATSSGVPSASTTT